MQILFERFLILRIIYRDTIKNLYRSSCKVPVILVSVLRNFNFLDRFSENTHDVILLSRGTNFKFQKLDDFKMKIIFL